MTSEVANPDRVQLNDMKCIPLSLEERIITLELQVEHLTDILAWVVSVANADGYKAITSEDVYSLSAQR